KSAINDALDPRRETEYPTKVLTFWRLGEYKQEAEEKLQDKMLRLNRKKTESMAKRVISDKYDIGYDNEMEVQGYKYTQRNEKETVTASSVLVNLFCKYLVHYVADAFLTRDEERYDYDGTEEEAKLILNSKNLKSVTLEAVISVNKMEGGQYTQR
ncbi:unnamed protein product, partial [Amoebophrya sp. A25]